MRTAILMAGMYIGDCLRTKPMTDDKVVSFYAVLVIVLFIMDVLEFTRGGK